VSNAAQNLYDAGLSTKSRVSGQKLSIRAQGRFIRPLSAHIEGFSGRFAQQNKKIRLNRVDKGTLSTRCLYDALHARYGELHWWPADSPYEMMVGAVLTQNTAWGNVGRAIANFGDRLNPAFVLQAELAALAEIIRPAGFFNQKAAYLKALTQWYARYDFDVPTVRREPLPRLRAELLATRGIGKETADSILLYAFGFPSFVVDAYTSRLCARLSLPAGNGYDAIQAYFTERLPVDAALYNQFHALIVIHAKTHCRKRPLCGDCPLGESCERKGV